MKYALAYGGISGAVAITVLCISLAAGFPSQAHSMAYGYLVMLAALSLIFVGVRHYRDRECGGVIGFGRAFFLSLGMALVAAVAYVIGWEIFIAVSGYDFIADYTAGIVSGMQSEGAEPAAIEAKMAEMREMGAMYDNPAFRLPMIFAEIFPVGLVVALVSASILRGRPMTTAAAR